MEHSSAGTPLERMGTSISSSSSSRCSPKEWRTAPVTPPGAAGRAAHSTHSTHTWPGKTASRTGPGNGGRSTECRACQMTAAVLLCVMWCVRCRQQACRGMASPHPSHAPRHASAEWRESKVAGSCHASIAAHPERCDCHRTVNDRASKQGGGRAHPANVQRAQAAPAAARPTDGQRAANQQAT